MVKYEQDTPGDRTYVCRGDQGCGVMLLGQDRARHSRHHALVLGMAEELDPSGTNDVEPLPERDPE